MSKIFSLSCFIEKARKDGNILVHCHGGISRSSTIIIAFLMKKMKKSFMEAYSYVKQIKKDIKPNDGFIQLLIEFEKGIFKVKF
jgi:protein-tyrosine phosphatase